MTVAGQPEVAFTLAELACLDPYPALARLRERDPVHRTPDGTWLLSRYADVDRVLRSRAFGAPVTKDSIREMVGTGALYEYMSRRLANYNPPDHTRLRQLLGHAFVPRRMEALRPWIEQRTDALLDAYTSGPFDLMSAVLHPLPSLVICELIGIPEADRNLFAEWTAAIAHLISASLSPGAELPAARRQAGEEAAAAFWGYLEALVEDRRPRAQGNDLISSLLATVDDRGGRLEREELIANMIFLFSAGHQTTRDQIGNGLIGMMQHRGQWERLVADPGLAAQAMEEALRYDASFSLQTRRALENVELAGRHIAAGDRVVCILIAANRDPARYPEPDRFMLDRRDIHPTSFGGGLHYCLGAPLARIEGEIVLRQLAVRLPKLRLALSAEQIQWRNDIVYRGPRHLPVAP
jgi:cytochrome P450